MWKWVLVFCCLATTVDAEVIRVPFYKLAPAKTVNLRCTNGEYTTSIPIPERWAIKRATMSVSYVNSANLLGDRSQLVAKINGHPFAQARLNPNAPAGKMDVSIPITFFEAGYNSLSFQVAQHYTQNCEQFCAPDLWTNLNFSDSFMEIEYTLKPVPLMLSKISDFLFDSKLFPQGEVNIITEDLSPEIINIAGLTASGIARRFDYRKVFFSVSKDIKPGYDNVLLGKKDFVEAFLKRKGVETKEIVAPFLKIMYLPKEERETDQSHALLVISGHDLGHVRLAAETLANMTLPYPGTDEMEVKEFDMPDISFYGGKQVLTPDRSYKLKNLNFNTHTFEGFNPVPAEISFRLPADFFIKPNNYAALTLNFSFGAGMRNDSVLNIQLNDKNVKVIHLNNVSGDSIEGYKVELPTYLFKSGTNTITLVPYLNPIAKECDLIRPDSYFLTIFDNSTLFFPAMPSFVEMPKIELFMQDGFPFTRSPDGNGSMIYLTQSDNDTIEAALNLIGLVTQRNGYPLSGIKIGFDKLDAWKGDAIVLSDVSAIPKDLLEQAPLKPAKMSSVPYPVAGGWNGESAMALSKQFSGIGQGSGAIMEFQSPYKRGCSMLLLTAASTSDLSALSRALLDPGVRSQSTGDLVLVALSHNDYKVTALSAGEKYITRKSGKVSMIDYYIYLYPSLYYISFGLLILFISITLFYYLRNIRSRRSALNAKQKGSGSSD